MSNPVSNSPILYIMVIGFHHKKGCQLEFVYPNDERIKRSSSAPPNEPDSNNNNTSDIYTLPKRWRHLPSMALPDGSHNYDTDYIYFHLEDDLDESEMVDASTQQRPKRTIFGISCYRQINASELLNKDEDVTRNTLQKSVCILSTLPIYSSIRLKLHSITCAYFNQKDFHKTQLLVNSFELLTNSYMSSLPSSPSSSNLTLTHRLLTQAEKKQQHYFIGLSVGDLVIRYQHKILILFKLLLLQKKCLFQLKPVSNLSNTIMSLVSLIPDIYSPDSKGLTYASGYFDSIDLVNSELQRKSSRKQKADNSPITDPFQTPIGVGNKKIKKKMLSFSRKHHHSSMRNSISSHSIKNEPAAPELKSPVNQSTGLLGMITTNTQRLFSNNQSKILNANLDTCDADLLHKDEILFEHAKLDLKTSQSSTSITDHNAIVNNAESPEDVKNMIKSKVSSVLKLVDWSQQNSVQPGEEVTESKNELLLNDLLAVDFGMPISLFNEFNMLHPYLSLYYLEYFTMINKMNTKLYCTTTLMMSMINEKQPEPEPAPENVNNNNESGNFSLTSSNSSTFHASSPPIPTSQQPQAPTNVGYTVGATNVLFKQRLYDDLDAFIDENDIDIRNEQLKKQLQLSTADLRFADYIIKHVQAARNTGNENNPKGSSSVSSASSSSHATPKLLSFKKTSSFGSFDKQKNKEETTPQLETSEPTTNLVWEGSDDWIRLNFKWYFYSLLASVVKEEVSSGIRSELDTIFYSLNSEANTTSSSSSSLSLTNDVIDIDDYIEKVTHKEQVTPIENETPKPENNNGKKSKSSSRKQSRKNSSSSSNSTVSSSQYYHSMTNNFLNYRDDFNSNYINELEKTDWYKEWRENTKYRLEKQLFKYDSSLVPPIQFQENDSNMDTVMLTRFQGLMAQYQDLEQIKLNHPFNGQISVSDIKLRFNFLFTATESGRKLNKALTEGSKLVNNTGKAVGDVFSQAKSSFSSFLSNWSSSSNNSQSNNSNNNNNTNNSNQLTSSSSSNLIGKSTSKSSIRINDNLTNQVLSKSSTKM